MSEIIVPRWLYEKAVHDLGQEVADKIMANHNAIVVGDWDEVTSAEPVNPGRVEDLGDGKSQ